MQHVQDFTLRHSSRRHSDADVFRRLQRRLRQTWCITPTAHLHSSHPRTIQTPDKKYVITAAVWRKM